MGRSRLGNPSYPARLRPATLLANPGAGNLVCAPGQVGELPHVQPIYQTAGYEVDDSAALDTVAGGSGYFYARHGAPNEDAVAALLAHLEQGDSESDHDQPAQEPVQAVVLASGMAAIEGAVLATLAPIMPPGGPQHVIAASALYGATTTLLRELRDGGRLLLHERPDMDAAALEALLRELGQPVSAAASPVPAGPVAAVYVEMLTNPLLRVPDLDVLGQVCARSGVALLVDATFATPLLCRPMQRGASLVIHSATKYLGGHGDLCAGVVAGSPRLIDRVRGYRRIHGAVIDPFAAWLLYRGLRTLSLRVHRQVDNAEALAAFLAGEAAALGIERVIYPGLPNHPDHLCAARTLDRPGAMLSFVLRDEAAARRTYDAVQVFRRVASLGDVDSLIMHPASSSHRALSEHERQRLGIGRGLLRISVGIEDIADLKDDLRRALSPATV